MPTLSLSHLWRRGKSAVTDMLFPPQCLSCREPVQNDGTFCSACFSRLGRLHDPECRRCGYPLPDAIPGTEYCGLCLANKPPYTLARSAVAYNAISRPLVSRLKFHDQLHLAEAMGRLMHARIRPHLDGVDAVLPVPLHRLRLWRRMSNQSLLLARVLARQAGLELWPHYLRRIRPTRRQTGLHRRERLKNLRRAFAVPEALRPAIQGKTLLLVDDVMTTGATLDACSRTLLKAGAKEVRIVTFARTLLQEG